MGGKKATPTTHTHTVQDRALDEDLEHRRRRNRRDGTAVDDTLPERWRRHHRSRSLRLCPELGAQTAVCLERERAKEDGIVSEMNRIPELKR